jgi:cytoskeleton protein RodZ
MSATEGSEARSGIGARLRAGRERMGMTVLQIAEKLHVDPKVVESLEAERFDELGAPVYVRGHLRRYADLTGESSAELLEWYASLTKPALPDLTQLPKAQRGTDPRRVVLAALVVLIAFALVGSVWWVLENLESGTAFGAPAAPVAAPGTGERGQPIPLDDQPVVLTDAPAASGSSPETREPADVAHPVAAAETPPAPAPAEPVRAQPMNVTLRFGAESWAEVYDAAGERLFYDIGAAGSSRTLSGTPPLRVLLGNAPAVSLDVDGSPAEVPAALVRRDGVTQFLINRSGRIVRVPRAAAAVAQPDGG